LRQLIAALLLAAATCGCAAAPSPSPSADSAERTDDARAARAFSTYLSARFAAGEHDLRQAALYYGRSLENDPGNSGLLALSFFYAGTVGDFEAAARYATAVVATEPDNRAARLALAVVAFRHKDYAEVRRQLSLSAKGPFTALTISLFDGWAAAGQNDKAAVKRDLVALSGQKGAQNMAAFHAALFADFMGQPDADALYQKALASGPVTPRVLEAYGRFLERAGRGADAADLYRSHNAEGGLASVTGPGLQRIAAGTKPDALIRSPEDGAAEALFGIAASLGDVPSADISIMYLRMALYLRPDFELANILLADRFETLKKYDDAIAIYRAIAPSSPYHRMAVVQAAIDAQRSGRTDEAIAGLKALTSANPKDTEAWTALGDAYRSLDRFANAVGAYDHAVVTIAHPAKKDWTLFYARAMTKERLHRLDDSEADIEAALKLSPEQPELLNYLGYSWVDRGRNLKEALGMLEKARSLRPSDGYIVDSVGWAYYRLGRYQDAADTLEQAVLLVPGDSTINDHFGDALWRAGRHIEARFQWNHAIAFSESETDKAAIAEKLKTGLAAKPA
jgi:tetratricopeptide (TPR) repeat protein